MHLLKLSGDAYKPSTSTRLARVLSYLQCATSNVHSVSYLVVSCCSRSFDFEGDERWRQYAANIEIPPGRDRDSVLKKFKAKWYKREIVSRTPDLNVSQITLHARAFQYDSGEH